MKGRNRKFEFIGALNRKSELKILIGRKKGTYPDQSVDIYCFVTMGLNLDTASQNIDQSLPLKVIGKFADIFPLARNSFRAILILRVSDLASLVVTENSFSVTSYAKVGIRKCIRFTEAPDRVHPSSGIYSAWMIAKERR